MTEEWKPCPQDPHYEVSSAGRVRSLGRTFEVPANHRTKGYTRHWKGGLLTPNILATTGYAQVMLSGRKKQSVHRLVASAFIPQPDDKPFVNHKNGVRSDNRVENLEWVTHSENLRHAYSHLGKIGWIKGMRGAAHPLCKPITYRGQTKTVEEWAGMMGWKANVIYGRIRYGWTLDEIFETEVGQKRQSVIDKRKAREMA